MPVKRKAPSETSTATIGFEAKLWLAADKQYLIAAANGKNHQTKHYSLQAIIPMTLEKGDKS